MIGVSDETEKKSLGFGATFCNLFFNHPVFFFGFFFRFSHQFKTLTRRFHDYMHTGKIA